MFSQVDMQADLWGIAPLLCLWVASFAILLGDTTLWKRGNKNLNPIVSVVGILLAFFYAATGPGGLDGLTAFGKGYALDKTGQAATIALLVTGLLSVLLAWGYLRARAIEHGEYYALLVLSLSGAIIMASANDLIVLFLGLEILSFGLYVLAGFARTEERSEEASIKYFLLGAFASAFLLFGIALVYGGTATTNIEGIRVALVNKTAAMPMVMGGISLMLVGLGFKAALVPFHQWTPDVYEGAPTSVTAYMAAAAKIAAFAAALRVFEAFASVGGGWLEAVRILAILTMVFGNLLAITQTNVKRLLAYSSIAHAGYLMVAVAAVGHEGRRDVPMLIADFARDGALFYLFAYAFMTLGAFGVLVYLSSRDRDVQHINDLRGLARKDPVAAYSMLFFMLSLGGIPPTMGFIGKYQIFLAGLQAHETVLCVVMALTSILGIYYYLKIVWMMCFEEQRPGAPELSNERGGAYVTVMVSVLATLLFGLAPGLLNTISGLGGGQ